MDGCLQDAMRAMPKNALPPRDPTGIDEGVAIEPTKQRYKLLHEEHGDIQHDLQLKSEQLEGKVQAKPMPASEVEHSKPTAILQVVTSSPILSTAVLTSPAASASVARVRPWACIAEGSVKDTAKCPPAVTRGPCSSDVLFNFA